MTAQQTEISEYSSLNTSVQMFKALGDETRMRMLGLLRHGELCVCDIMEVLKLPQSTASRHLACLRNAGWVNARRGGKWIYYRLSREPLTGTVCTCISDYLAFLPQVQEDYRALELHLRHKVKETCE